MSAPLPEHRHAGLPRRRGALTQSGSAWVNPRGLWSDRAGGRGLRAATEERVALTRAISAKEVRAEEAARVLGAHVIEVTEPEEPGPLPLVPVLGGGAQAFEARWSRGEGEDPEGPEPELPQGSPTLPPGHVAAVLRAHPLHRNRTHVDLHQERVDTGPDAEHGEGIGDEGDPMDLPAVREVGGEPDAA